MKYLVMILIFLPVFAFAQVVVIPSGNVLYIEDITQEPWEPEPIDIYSNDDIQRDSERIEREVDEANERMRESISED